MINKYIFDYGVLVLVFVIISMNVYGLFICKRFIDRLKATHRDAWLEMGSPELINAENAFEANRLFLFIAFGRFLTCKDGELSRDGMVMQGIIVATLIGLIAIFLLLK
jgi:hypothetical protein